MERHVLARELAPGAHLVSEQEGPVATPQSTGEGPSSGRRLDVATKGDALCRKERIAMTRWPDLLSRLTRAVAAQPAAALPQQLCTAFAEIVDARGAAITMGQATKDRAVLCATDDLAERIEDLQDVLREGPSLDAFLAARQVALTEDASRRALWPMLVETLSSWPPPTPDIYAFPMKPQSAVLGVLSAYGEPHHGLAVSDEEAQILANAIGVAILGQARDEDWLGRRWIVRDRISQATGMVVAQLGLAPPDALAVLRAHAFAHNTTLSNVSRQVVDKTLRFTKEDGAR